MTPTPIELQDRLHDIADRVADTPEHRRTHVAVLLERLERLVPAYQPEPDDDDPDDPDALEDDD